MQEGEEQEEGEQDAAPAVSEETVTMSDADMTKLMKVCYTAQEHGIS